jgi:hypothetical protein
MVCLCRNRSYLLINIEQSEQRPYRLEDHLAPPKDSYHGESAHESFRRWIQQVRLLYDSGQPMYPRDTIADVVRQLDSGQTICSVHQWDGQVKKIDVTRKPLL